MQGVDFSPLYLAAKPPTWRDEFFYEFATVGNISKIPASLALVRKNEKFIIWPDFKKEQLFNLVSDSHEENDLSDDPSQKAKMTEMRTELMKLSNAAK